MIKTSQCSNCAIIFSYNDKDSKGIYCTRKCHYQSKKQMAICKNCGKDFQKNLKEKKQTCSIECYRLRRASKSRDEAIKNQAHLTNSENAGQTSLHQSTPGNFMPVIPPDEQFGNFLDGIEHGPQENVQRFPFEALLKKSFKKLVLDAKLYVCKWLSNNKDKDVSRD